MYHETVASSDEVDNLMSYKCELFEWRC